MCQYLINVYKDPLMGKGKTMTEIKNIKINKDR